MQITFSAPSNSGRSGENVRAFAGGAGESMKQMLVYERPMAINRERHRRLRIRRGDGGYPFARSLNSVPLLGSEFAVAARDFPIVFAGADAGAPMPAALLGLARDENLFVDADGRWADDVYVPAFLRRYPFVIAEKAGSDDFTVCVDASVVDDGDDAQRLFEDDGSDAPLLQEAMRFLGEYQRDVRRTRHFMEQLIHHRLLVEKVVKVERPGRESGTLSGFSIVDEMRLQNLGAKSLQKLAKSGALGLAVAHLMSLPNVQRLSARMDRMHAGAGALH